MARKTRGHYEVTPELLKKVEKLAGRGLTIVQIGISLGWSEETIHKKKRENPELAESIKRGQVKGIKEITNALFKRAKGFSYKEIHEGSRIDSTGKAVIEHRKTIKKKVLPDTIAQIFYLKNRDPENWKDRQDHSISGGITIRIDQDDNNL